MSWTVRYIIAKGGEDREDARVSSVLGAALARVLTSSTPLERDC